MPTPTSSPSFLSPMILHAMPSRRPTLSLRAAFGTLDPPLRVVVPSAGDRPRRAGCVKGGCAVAPRCLRHPRGTGHSACTVGCLLPSGSLVDAAVSSLCRVGPGCGVLALILDRRRPRSADRPRPRLTVGVKVEARLVTRSAEACDAPAHYGSTVHHPAIRTPTRLLTGHHSGSHARSRRPARQQKSITSNATSSYKTARTGMTTSLNHLPRQLSGHRSRVRDEEIKQAMDRTAQSGTTQVGERPPPCPG
jgi:hypothetical protein